MKYLKQFLMILAISFLGEGCGSGTATAGTCQYLWYGDPVCGSVTGMIQLDWVKDAGKFLIEIMPVMFIPQEWV